MSETYQDNRYYSRILTSVGSLSYRKVDRDGRAVIRGDKLLATVRKEDNFSQSDGESSLSDQLLVNTSKMICSNRNIGFSNLTPIQRLFIMHYRCHACGLLPLYYLDLVHIKRVRCTKCSNLISFTSSGKYGKIRKEIAFTLRGQLQQNVPERAFAG